MISVRLFVLFVQQHDAYTKQRGSRALACFLQSASTLLIPLSFLTGYCVYLVVLLFAGSKAV